MNAYCKKLQAASFPMFWKYQTTKGLYYVTK